MHDEDDTEPACPYCGSTDDCRHLLLVVDQTFRHAEGGLLMEEFNRRWSDTMQASPDGDESEPFDALVEEVDVLANATARSASDSVPGMSSAYGIYYVSSVAKGKAALKAFKG